MLYDKYLQNLKKLMDSSTESAELLPSSGPIPEDTGIRPDRLPCIGAVSPMQGNEENLAFSGLSMYPNDRREWVRGRRIRGIIYCRDHNVME
jgi:hypothetical protein